MLAALGGGDATTLAQALELAGARGTVLVRPGVYQAQLAPSASVTVAAEKAGTDVVFETASPPALWVAADVEVTVRGVTFRVPAGEAVPPADGAPSAIIAVSAGTLVLDGCAVEGAAATAVDVEGAKTLLRAKALAVRGACDHGVVARGGATVELDGAELAPSGNTGVMAADAATKLTVRNARLRGHRGFGLAVGDGAAAMLDGVRLEQGRGVQLFVTGAATKVSRAVSSSRAAAASGSR